MSLWKVVMIATVTYIVLKNVVAKVVNPLISSTGFTL